MMKLILAVVAFDYSERLFVQSKDKQSDFEKFDKVMSGLLAVPYKELQAELAKDRKAKARKKRAKAKKASERAPSRDSGGEA
jgi:hypothetical protein